MVVLTRGGGEGADMERRGGQTWREVGGDGKTPSSHVPASISIYMLKMPVLPNNKGTQGLNGQKTEGWRWWGLRVSIQSLTRFTRLCTADFGHFDIEHEGWGLGTP